MGKKIVILGSERLLVDEELKRFLGEIEVAPEDIIRFSGYSEEISMELECPSFWGRKVILIASQDGKDIPGDLLNTEHQNDLIVTVNEIDKRSALYKALNGVTVRYCDSLSDKNLIDELINCFHDAGLNITQSTMEILLEYLDYGGASDLSAAKLVAEQIISCCEVTGSCEVTQETIARVCEDSSSGNRFKIIKYLEDGDYFSVLGELKKVKKEDELLVLGLLMSKFRVKFKLSLFPDEQEGIKKLGVKPWSILKVSVGQDALRDGMNNIFTAIQDIKSGCGELALRVCLQKLSLLLSKDREE